MARQFRLLAVLPEEPSLVPAPMSDCSQSPGPPAPGALPPSSGLLRHLVHIQTYTHIYNLKNQKCCIFLKLNVNAESSFILLFCFWL